MGTGLEQDGRSDVQKGITSADSLRAGARDRALADHAESAAFEVMPLNPGCNDGGLVASYCSPLALEPVGPHKA